MDVKENLDSPNVFIAYGTDIDTGEKYSIKFTKTSDTPHSHTYKTSPTTEDYFNISDDIYAHYVPSACDSDEKLHEIFYLHEDHTSSYYQSEGKYTCEKCNRVKPYHILFCATNSTEHLTTYYPYIIERSVENFTDTGDSFTISRDGHTYRYEGITIWHTSSSTSEENYKGKSIPLKEGKGYMYIYFDYDSVTEITSSIN